MTFHGFFNKILSHRKVLLKKKQLPYSVASALQTGNQTRMYPTLSLYDLISSSPYHLSYNSFHVSSENLVSDQLIIP